MTQSRSLEGRIALITGASRGIGAAISKRYAAEGAHVILTARTTAALEEVYDEILALGTSTSATILPMDLGNRDEVDQLGSAISQRFGRLDIFVANAAQLGELTPVTQVTPEIWDKIIDINLSAQWRMIRTLEIPLLSSPAGRAIFLTSGVSGGRGYWGPYAVSKTALEALARTWADEVSHTNLRINLINPGAVRTSMRAEAYPGEDPSTVLAPSQISDIFVKLGSSDFKGNGETHLAQ
ncbi:MAG: SDR family NAD(P)-dependent oxidoreductase [Alphaproteobacteria bacterium]